MKKKGRYKRLKTRDGKDYSRVVDCPKEDVVSDQRECRGCDYCKGRSWWEVWCSWEVESL